MHVGAVTCECSLVRQTCMNPVRSTKQYTRYRSGISRDGVEDSRYVASCHITPIRLCKTRCPRSIAFGTRWSHSRTTGSIARTEGTDLTTGSTVGARTATISRAASLPAMAVIACFTQNSLHNSTDKEDGRSMGRG